MVEEITLVSAQLDYKFEEAKAHLEEQIAPYRNVVFTEDTKKEAKETVAQLRKDRSEFEQAVKNLKKEYMKPFDAFYDKAKELMGMYDEPIKAINDQIGSFEEKRKQEKMQIISDIYDEMIPEDDMRSFIPLQAIFNQKWLNATASKKQIMDDIMEAKLNAKTAIQTIKAMKSEKEDEALRMYQREFDLSKCIIFLNQYEQQKAEILRAKEAQIRKEEEDRIRAEERAKIEAEQKKAEEISQAVEQAKTETIEAFIPEDTDEEEAEYSYSIKLTASQKEKLEMFMNSIGIEYEEICF